MESNKKPHAKYDLKYNIFCSVEIGLFAKIMAGHSGEYRLPDVS